ncbi:MAG TPA: type II secretion system major pseudopilin GspG [Chthonomonadales bacterium]|nr:type II secretion system major pseudopilin GspG [Chthonomonadales bacterium]
MVGALVQRRRDRAFTLIELLVVIIILAILAAVVIPRVIGRTDDARIAKATSDVSAIDNALDQFRIDVGAYPSADEGLQALDANVGNVARWNGPYLKNGLPNDPWGNPYMYRIPPEQGTDYDVYSAGPDGQPGTSDDIGNWNLNQ